VYQAYPIALQRPSERFDFFQALVGDLFCPIQVEPRVPSREEFTGRVEIARLGWV
jgi:hypothetical protein